MMEDELSDAELTYLEEMERRDLEDAEGEYDWEDEDDWDDWDDFADCPCCDPYFWDFSGEGYDDEDYEEDDDE